MKRVCRRPCGSGPWGLTQHSPHTAGSPLVLAAPGPVRPTFPASAPLPLVHQTAAPAPCRPQVSGRHFLCCPVPPGCGTTKCHRGDQDGSHDPPPSEICSVLTETPPIVVYTNGHVDGDLGMPGLVCTPVHTCMGVLWGLIACSSFPNFHSLLPCSCRPRMANRCCRPGLRVFTRPAPAADVVLAVGAGLSKWQEQWVP